MKRRQNMSVKPINIYNPAELEWLEAIAIKPNAVDGLKNFARILGEKAVFSTSFSMEDQVITHMIFSNNLNIKVFTLDTGRLFPETYSTWARTIEKYGKPIATYFPDADQLEPILRSKGPNSFYESIENRQECCNIRKVEPLKRALAGHKLWVTGIRSEHSTNRTQMNKMEWDSSNELFKFHPLLNWTTDELKEFVKQYEIPVNPLHDKGFVSIGCAPCTRAIKAGEDFRAGRWWWEEADKKECGLHVHAS
jgi:phosphoadenosine phosphosulfate reductase